MIKKGFTLIEMLIVIAILALIAAFIVPQISPISERAKLSNSVKFFSQSFYETQTKAQTGFQEIASSDATNFDPNYKIFGLSLSTIQEEGARTFTSNNISDKNYSSLTPVAYGKNILSAEDSAKNIYSTIKEIKIADSNPSRVEIYFLPISNTIIVKSDGKVVDNPIIQITFANKRYPVMQQKLEINTGTSLIRSLPLSNDL